MTTLGQKIAIVRLVVKETQKVFCKRFNVGQSTLARWELDQNDPPYRALLEIQRLANENKRKIGIKIDFLEEEKDA